MRSSPTFAYLGLGILAAAIIVGCSASTLPEEPVDDSLPDSPAPTETGGDDEDAPAFHAEFKDGGKSSEDDKKDSGSTDDDNLGCIDPDDPGGAENVAKSLPDTNDCDNSYRSVGGVADGPVDVDWYKFKATDEGWSLSHPISCERETDFVNETNNIELCVYATCANGAQDGVKSCSDGSSTATNALGMKGCCVKGPGQAVPKVSCASVTKDDSAVFYMSVRQVNTAQCLPYKFRYRY